jgi:hypothetical protein
MLQPPEQDVEARRDVWDWLQMIYMDTDVGDLVDRIAEACAKSPYAIDELEAILWNEVYPACRFNIFETCRLRFGVEGTGAARP